MIEQDLLGWITFILIFFIIFTITKINPKTTNFLFVAFFLRSLFVILDQYFITLPDSTGDAFIFEQRATIYSEKYGLNVFFNSKQDSFFISRVISIFYTLFDRSELMAKMFSVGIGTSGIFLIYRLTQILWDDRTASKAAWFATLFPSFILYSSLILREVYVVFFLTFALIGCINFINENKIIHFVRAFFGFLVAAFFHGPMIFGFFIFLIYIVVKILKQNNYFLRFKKKKIYLIFLLPILLFPIITYLMGFYSIPKIGTIDDLTVSKGEDKKLSNIKETLILRINIATRSSANNDSGAGYPSWTVPNNLIELIYLAPVRMSYFLYSPFPWDIKRLKHFVGLLDVLFYFYLSFCIIRNRKFLFKNPETRFLFIILFMYVFAYSFGVGNFGTGIRHRLKFISLLIALAAPRIVRIRFIQSNNFLK